MKRLVPPLLTIEDARIMSSIRQRWKYPLNHWYQYCDRCDADLMFSAQAGRHQMYLINKPTIGVFGTDGEVVQCGGEMKYENPVWRHRHST